MEELKVNDSLEESPPDMSKVSMVKEKGGQESMGNIEGDNEGSKVHGNNDNLASSLPERDEEGNMMEVEMEAEVLKGNETSQVFPPDTLKVSKVKEKDGEESKENVEGDNAGSELHKKEKFLTVQKNLEMTVQKYPTVTI
eukprot:9852649-Ditylum_brightwellii.AAC.2